MLFVDIFLKTFLLFPIPVSAVPLYSRALNSPSLANAYLSASHFNFTDTILGPESQILCFQNKIGLNLTAVAQDCATVVFDIILRLDGLFEKRVFFRQKYEDSNGRWVPSQWKSGQCTISARSAQSTSVDLFTLFEIAQSARKILSHCVTSRRKGQGGYIPIGSQATSYNVVLQGSLPDVNANAVSDAKLLAHLGSDVSKGSLSRKRAVLRPTELQPQITNSSVALINLNETMYLSNSAGDLRANAEPETDCFPLEAPLPPTNADDCSVIINHVILAMEDPFGVQTWGFTDAVDNNLALPQYQWNFQTCSINVRNIDRSQVDSFRPVDVAEVAQRLVQKCVTETKTPIGGTADVGHLEEAEAFYVVVAGMHSISGETPRNSTVLSFPSDGRQTSESRASLNSPEENTLPSISSVGLNEDHPVDCFSPASAQRLERAIASDCDFIINSIILGLPNPMMEQTFGYTDDVDINLSIKDNGRWIFGQCVVLLTNTIKTTSRDRFRFVDVAYTAQRITEQCVVKSKYGIGGLANIGALENHFFVGVGGLEPEDLGNSTTGGLASLTTTASPAGLFPALPSRYGTDSSSVAKRSSNTTEVSQAGIEFAPAVRCFRPGMPAARRIDIQDCNNLAMLLLRDPNILVSQTFTTEPTGGIHMPFLQQRSSCYLMVDTNLEFSVSESFSLLQVVYWASAIMQRCFSKAGEGLGGISRLDNEREIFVSVTGVDPSTVGNGMADLTNPSLSVIPSGYGNTQIVDLGQT